MTFAISREMASCIDAFKAASRSRKACFIRNCLVMSGANRLSHSLARLIGERDLSLQKHLGEIAQAQLLSESPQNNEQNHIGGIFEKIAWCSYALVEAMLPNETCENQVRSSGFSSLGGVEAQYGQFMHHSFSDESLSFAYLVGDHRGKPFSEF